jgi:hypothetical protein
MESMHMVLCSLQTQKRRKDHMGPFSLPVKLTGIKHIHDNMGAVKLLFLHFYTFTLHFNMLQIIPVIDQQQGFQQHLPL